jgi:ARF7 effector protein C-terminus
MKPEQLTTTARKSTAQTVDHPRTSSRNGAKKRKFVFSKPRKPVKKALSDSANTLYDGNGKIRGTKENLCDCFEKTCHGCHFECEICKSQKCGSVCRRFRKFSFEVIEHDGKAKKDTNTCIATMTAGD